VEVSHSYIAAWAVFCIELPRCATLDTWMQYLRNATLLAVLISPVKGHSILDHRTPSRTQTRAARTPWPAQPCAYWPAHPAGLSRLSPGPIMALARPLRALFTMRCYPHIQATLHNVSHEAPEVRCNTLFWTNKPFFCWGHGNRSTYLILASAYQE